MLRFDHVVIAVADLGIAADEILVNHGLASVEGGRHAGHGTANRIVPLGTDYLELVAVVDEGEASSSSFGRWVARHSSSEATRALCLRSSRIDDISKRLTLSPVPMARVRPDGVELRWRLLGMESALERDLPFFIEWDVAPSDYPGRASAEHETSPHGISWVELAGERQKVEGWMGPNDLAVRAVNGSPGIHRVGIATDSGDLVL